MEESVTYQEIIRKGAERGAIEELRKVLLLQGRKRFGPPTPATKAAVESITDLERLESMSERLLDVNSWAELLGESAPKRRNGGKRKGRE
jgi:hypothetical protein